jgi:hypothetical protein
MLAGAGKLGVLREETVTGMDCIGAAAAGGVDDRRDIQVGLLHRGRADVDGFVGHLHVQCIGVGIAEYGDGAVAQRLGGALDAAGDFTAVGDQDFADPGMVGFLGFAVNSDGLFAGKPAPTGELYRLPMWELACSRSF